MGEKQCTKCGEMVDEAKAFCPGCGHAFVDEKKRTSVSDFDQSQSTVQLGNTMYNQMLSDMGLNISKKPKTGEISVGGLKPAAPDQGASRNPAVEQTSKAPAGDKYFIWRIVIVSFAILAFLIILAVAAIIIALYSR